MSTIQNTQGSMYYISYQLSFLLYFRPNRIHVTYLSLYWQCACNKLNGLYENIKGWVNYLSCVVTQACPTPVQSVNGARTVLEHKKWVYGTYIWMCNYEFLFMRLLNMNVHIHPHTCWFLEWSISWTLILSMCVSAFPIKHIDSKGNWFWDKHNIYSPKLLVWKSKSKKSAWLD